jgi:O-antigen/teichoic acid export membrane protein
MLSAIKQKVMSALNSDNERSRKLRKNVATSFAIKGGTILIGLILVPMTINYIGPTQYGIWLTISSIVSWMAFFDIGLGNGLRNKLAFSLAHKKHQEAKIYVSTTYATLTGISILMFAFFWVLNPFIDWRTFLNIPTNVPDDIQNILLIALSMFCVQFIVQLINMVLVAAHETAIAGFISFLGQLLIVISIIIMKMIVPGSLQVLVITLMICPIIVLVISSIYFYNFKYNNIAPSFSRVDFRYAKDILGIGGVFFFIQIGALILFQTNNIILIKILGPEAVTQYNIVYKLFFLITMIFTIVATPYWSAFTDAHAKNDIEWMMKSIKILQKIWLLLSIGCIFLLFFSPWIFKYWIGEKIKIDFMQSITMTVYVIVTMWQTIYVYFLNGLSKVRIQLILVIIGSSMNIPLAIYLVNLYGVAGVTMANIVIFTFMGIFFTIQTNKILSGKAKNIWAK